MGVVCKICDKEFKNWVAIASHITKIHHIKSKDYYDKYLSPSETHLCLNCGKETKFKDIKFGYHIYCSMRCVNNSDIAKDKIKQTCLERYGVENPNELDLIKDKIKQTNLEKYGVEYSFQSELVKDKSKLKLLELYGVENISQCENIKDNKKQKSIDKYGVDYVFQSDVIKQKIRETNLERYGAEYVGQVPEIRKLTSATKMYNFCHSLLISDRLKSLVEPHFDLDDYKGTNYKYSWKCHKCDNIFEDSLNGGKIPRCPTCFPVFENNRSILEKELSDFCKIYYPNLIESNRTILNGKELDIYIPEKNLAIEFDGLYWHSELQGKDQDYHLNKTIQCKEKYINLIHIFEDEWLNKPEIIKSMILNTLEIYENFINIDETTLIEINNIDANNFLSVNHIKNGVSGNHIGLYYKDELVSILSIQRSKIVRFCNKLNTQIIGSFSKLLNYILKTYDSIIIYDDLRYSNDKLYLKNNFKLIELSEPECYYMKDYRNRVKYKPILEEFDSDLTEWQNMQLNDYDRIWDCGNYIFKFKE